MFTGFPRGRWVAFGEIVLVVAVLAGIVVGALRAGADLQAFVGRFHPLIVHLPIGFLLLTAVVEGLARTARYASASRIVPVLLGLTAASTLAAIVTGTLLSGSGDYDAALVGRHQIWGIYLGVAVILACAAAWLRTTQAGRGPRMLFTGAFAASVVLLGVTGHFGGSLTHGDSYLTEHMPAVPFLTRATASATRGPVDLSSTPVFTTLVAPTLDARCVQCHGPSRQAGKLRLDSPEAIRKGGESGPVVVAGNAARSELVRRIFLPTSDKKSMPPKGHPAPSHADVSLLRWWIDQGASFEQMLSDVQVTPELEPAIVDRIGPVDFSAPAILAVRVAPAAPRALDALKALKLRVEPLRADSSLLLVQAPPAARAFADANLKALEPLAAQIAWLDLGGTAVTDDGLVQVLPKLVNLWKLSLDRTAITDRALVPLANLQRLETVNVYATQVSDAGLAPLGKLARLRSVYAWKTRVTPQGADSLQASLKKVRVNVGAPPTPDAEPVEGSDQKSQKIKKAEKTEKAEKT